MKTKIAIVSGILFAAILFTGITSSFMFPGLSCPAGTIVKNDVCVIASTDCEEGTTYQDGVCVVDKIEKTIEYTNNAMERNLDEKSTDENEIGPVDLP